MGHGYANVAGLKSEFAIELDNYDEKEKLLHEIFSKSRAPNTELFVLDADLVTQLLSSFEGRKIYPEIETKKEVYSKSKNELKSKQDVNLIPDGTYTLNRVIIIYEKVSDIVGVEDGVLTVKSCAECATLVIDNPPKDVLSANVFNDELQEDQIFTSPSSVAFLVVGNNVNGWMYWMNKDGDPIDIYRRNNKD